MVLLDLNLKNMSQKEKYKNLLDTLESIVKNESNLITNLSNASAVLNFFIDKINWCGFYLVKDDELILGPFQGMPACTKIKMGKGVCGKAAKEKSTVIVDNVHEFEGHIACDSASNSEIVVPIIKDKKLYGVIDIDSPYIGRFTDLDKLYLEKCSNILSTYLNWEN
ncbi:GAF domain-containing protein [Clostridium sp. cel8]|uniref:GAF domain-containing protein n=1 Tax=Clostridium sp. cel8 TaxID=2663123 RepID=UPI0015F35BBF|nr:GAF domain-containing protein [Clostridium sp. cel8]